MKKLLIFSTISLLSLSACQSAIAPTTHAPVGAASFSPQNNPAHQAWQRALIVYREMKDFTADMDIWSAARSFSVEERDQSTMAFRKPYSERIDILQSADEMRRGMQLVYLGGDKVEILLAKNIPFLGRRFTLGISDNRLKTSRGWRIDQIDVPAIAKRISQVGQLIEDAGEGSVGGRPVRFVKFFDTFRGIDPVVTHEVIGFDEQTGFLLSDEVYEGETRVFALALTNFKMDVGLPDSIFKLPPKSPEISKTARSRDARNLIVHH